jgi:hypothetical protein
MAADSFSNGLDFLTQELGIDNYGFPIYVSLLYRVFDTPLIVNLANAFLNTFTTYFNYKIGRHFLSKQNACIAALIFGLATYSIYYQASGLKETLMIFLIIGSFHFYYKYLSSQKIIYFIYALIWCLTIFFFRVPLVFFLLLAFLYTEASRMKFFAKLAKLKFNYKTLIFITVIITIGATLLYTKFKLLSRYFSLIILAGEIREATFSQGAIFVYVTSFLAGILGPFPTIIPHAHNMNLSVLSGSLIVKVFLSIYFIFGVYVGFKNKFIMPIALFSLMEIGALSYVMESFEFRKCYPHIPFVILVSIYGFQYIANSKQKYLLWKIAFRLYIPFITFFMFLWNYLRI